MNFMLYLYEHPQIALAIVTLITIIVNRVFSYYDARTGDAKLNYAWYIVKDLFDSVITESITAIRAGKFDATCKQQLITAMLVRLQDNYALYEGTRPDAKTVKTVTAELGDLMTRIENGEI